MSSSSGSGSNDRVVKPSRQESLVPGSGSPVLQDAATPERDAKKRRLDRDEPDRVVDDEERSPGMGGRRGLPPQTPPSRRLARKTSLGSDGVPCPRMSSGPSPTPHGDTAKVAVDVGEAQSSVRSVGVWDSGMSSGSGSAVRGRGRGRGGSVAKAAAADTACVRGASRGGRRGVATGPSASAAEERRAAAVVADAAPVRRSARVAARGEGATTAVSGRGRVAGGGRIVTGFGAERVEDVAADERRRIAENARRGDERRETGTRGRVTDCTGADLDRSAGGAWHAGRR